MSETLTRRRFILSGLAGGAALAAGPFVPRLAAATTEPAEIGADRDWFEATVPALQRAMARGRLSSAELTRWYLERIEELNPVLSAVIETNPKAVSVARARDAERRSGVVRGPLHGIPVLLKDNIATNDRMETTAGSLALVGADVRRDASIVARLRNAGAVLLGKANLSEWANFRGFAPMNGWSARGGFTRNPYVLDLDPCGSSSGSAAGVAANLSALAVGTETDGSIICPSGEQAVVGIKPTVGLVSQRGIIPIAASQDTAGPMCRSVTDAAHLLNVLRTPFGPVLGRRLPKDYTAFLDAGALEGARIAYDRRYVDGDFGPGDDALLAVVDDALAAMSAAGADIDEITSDDPVAPTAEGRVPFDDEFTVLLFEFKVQIAQYLAGLRGTEIRTLADLIAFNSAHCEQEMTYFGQEIFELAEATSGDLSDPEYLAALATSQGFGRGVIDRARAQGFDAVLTPSYSFGSTAPATAGYPSMSVPVGFTPTGRPVGVWLAAGFLQEPKLISLGYAIEQLLQARRQPKLTGELPPELPDAEICEVPPGHAAAKPRPQGRRRMLG